MSDLKRTVSTAAEMRGLARQAIAADHRVILADRNGEVWALTPLDGVASLDALEFPFAVDVEPDSDAAIPELDEWGPWRVLDTGEGQ